MAEDNQKPATKEDIEAMLEGMEKLYKISGKTRKTFSDIKTINAFENSSESLETMLKSISTINKEIELYNQQSPGATDYMRIFDSTQKEISKARKELSAIIKLKKEYENIDNNAKDRIELLKREVQALKDSHDGNEETLEIIKEKESEISALNEALDGQEERLLKLKDAVDKFNTETKASIVGMELAEEAMEGLEDATSGFLSKIGFAGDGLLDSGKSAAKFMKAIQSNPVKVLNSGVDRLNKILVNHKAILMGVSAVIAGAFIAATTRMITELDEASAMVARLTGNSREMIGVLEQSNTHMMSMGGSVRDAAEGFISLYTQVASFSKIANKTDIIGFTKTMENLGVSTDDTARMFDHLVSSLQMSFVEAKNVSVRLVKVAKSLELPVEKMVQGFIDAQPKLAAYGRKAVEVFEEVAAAAKATSLTTQELLGIVDQFDTFDGAAEAAGRLSAALGGSYLNATEAMLATEGERIKMIQEAMRLSGLEYENMNKFERMNIGAAIGITDISELNKLFGTLSQEVGEYQATLNVLGVSTEEIEAASRSAVTLSDKLSALWQAFAVSVAPVVETLNDILDTVLEINNSFDGKLIPALAIAGAVGALAFAGILAPALAVAGVIAGMAVSLMIVTKLFNHFRKAGDSVAQAMMKAGIAISILMPPLGALITVVSFLSMVFDEISKEFNKVKDDIYKDLEPAINTLREAFSPLIDVIGITGESSGVLGVALDILTSIISLAAKVIAKSLVGTLHTVVGIFSAIIEGISASTNLLMGFFTLFTGGGFDQALEYFSSFVTNLENMFWIFIKTVARGLKSLSELMPESELAMSINKGADKIIKAANDSIESNNTISKEVSKSKENLETKNTETVDKINNVNSEMRSRTSASTRERKEFYSRFEKNTTLDRVASSSDAPTIIRLELDGKKMTEVVVDNINKRNNPDRS